MRHAHDRVVVARAQSASDANAPDFIAYRIYDTAVYDDITARTLDAAAYSGSAVASLGEHLASVDYHCSARDVLVATDAGRTESAHCVQTSCIVALGLSVHREHGTLRHADTCLVVVDAAVGMKRYSIGENQVGLSENGNSAFNLIPLAVPELSRPGIKHAALLVVSNAVLIDIRHSLELMPLRPERDFTRLSFRYCIDGIALEIGVVKPSGERIPCGCIRNRQSVFHANIVVVYCRQQPGQLRFAVHVDDRECSGRGVEHEVVRPDA